MLVRRAASFLVLCATVALTGCTGGGVTPSPLVVTPRVESETPRPAPSTTDDPGELACPDGLILPYGVDPVACGSAPAHASTIPDDRINSNSECLFASPTGNIRCDWYDDHEWDVGVQCVLREAEFEGPPKLADCDFGWDKSATSISATAETGMCSGDSIGAWYEDDIPVLGYGEAITHQRWACASTRDGMTCWNTETHHGFKLLRTVQLTW